MHKEKSSHVSDEGGCRYHYFCQRRTERQISSRTFGSSRVRKNILLKSVATESQLFEVLARPYLACLVAPITREWFKNVLAAAELVTITERIVACRDPTDDKFLELAVNGRADLIVTGDSDLLVLNPFRAIPILAPAAFVQAVSR